MDIPTDFFMPDALFRQKGNIAAVVLLSDSWQEQQQPKLFFWKPESMFHDAWKPDAFFSLTAIRNGNWQEVHYSLEAVSDFVYPTEETDQQTHFQVQADYLQDLRSRHRRVVEWLLMEAWHSMKMWRCSFLRWRKQEVQAESHAKQTRKPDEQTKTQVAQALQETFRETGQRWSDECID